MENKTPWDYIFVSYTIGALAAISALVLSNLFQSEILLYLPLAPILIIIGISIGEKNG